jgi:hypothetical protein
MVYVVHGGLVFHQPLFYMPHTLAHTYGLRTEHATSRLQAKSFVFRDGHGRFQHASSLLIVTARFTDAGVYSFSECYSVHDGHVCVLSFRAF